MTVYIFGAGSTYGTLRNHSTCPPLARDFGKHLARVNHPNLAAVASHLGRDLENLGLEEIWSCIDYYAKFTENRGGFLKDPGWLCGSVWELKRAILSTYGRGCDTVATTLNKSTCTLVALLNRVQNGDAVISFNYDTLIERLARKLGRHLRHGTGGARTAIRFAKPHGSTSWRVSGTHPPVGGRPLLRSLEEVSVVCGCSRTEPIVLGAVPIKSELIAEVQCYWGAYDVFKVIMRQWQVVVEAIREADVVIVAGYSFPKEDHHGRFLFTEGVPDSSQHAGSLPQECLSLRSEE
jgi:hypothetical protein